MGRQSAPRRLPSSSAPPVVALVVAAVLSAFAVPLLTGRYLAAGPVLLRFAPDHGVHAGDLFVVLGWAAALLAVGGLMRGSDRRDG